MSAAGDAVLAMARSQLGVTEQPPGSNQVPYWDWYGGNYGSWCACFVSWCNWHANYPLCAVDSAKGFILVSSGTVHSYPEGEAQPTADLQPGDCVLFSWYPWVFIDGMPIIVNDPEWSGYVAGDHTGIFAYWIDHSTGQFACVEGNTSQSSWDNGGAVLERTDRYTSQVCGWWRVPSIEGAEPGPGPEPEQEEDEDVYTAVRVTTPGPMQGGVYLTAGSFAVAIADGNLLNNLISRGLCKPDVVEVADFDVYGCYQIVSATGPQAMR